MPITIFVGSFLLPETPHWLLSKGRVRDAERVMLWLRRGTPQKLVLEEVQLVKVAIGEQRELHYASSYLDCFKGTNLQRTMIAIGVQVFQQLQGASVSPALFFVCNMQK